MINSLVEKLVNHDINLVTESVNGGLVIVDDKSRVIEINTHARNMLGLGERESLLGKDWCRILDMTYMGKVDRHVSLKNCPVKKALKFNQKISEYYYYKRSDGSRIPVVTSIAPIIVGGRIKGAVEVFKDVTKEKRTDEAKSDVISIVSHQLRTPLSIINLYCHLLKSEVINRLTKAEIGYLDEIYKNNKRMVGLVDSLLNTTRLEGGVLSVFKKNVDVAFVMDDVIHEFLPEIEGKKIAVRKKYSSKKMVLCTDEKLLNITLSNLLDNAICYSKFRGCIGITIKSKKGRDPGILIEISDQGYGVPKKQQLQIFSKMFRADNAKKVTAEGTGLGLYTCKMAVDKLGGKIWFDSAGQEKGATFYVFLPR